MSLREKIIFGAVFMGAILFLFIGSIDDKKESIIEQSDIYGQVIKANTWNNYGYQVRLYQQKKVVQKTKTSLNGSFIFQDISDGAYTLMFFDDDIYLSERRVTVPAKRFILKLPAKERESVFFDFVVLVINTILLFVGIIFLYSSRSTIAIYYLIMLSAPFIYNTIELTQNIMASYSMEILAANISVLKLFGLIFFGPAFFSFFRILLDKKKISGSAMNVLYIIMVVEVVILLSMLRFNNDLLFLQFWHFPFPLFRNLLILQTFMGFDLGVKTIYQGKLDYLSREMANRLQFMFFAVIFTVIFLTIMVFAPVILFEKELFPFTFSISIASVIMFGSFFYGLRGYRIPFIGYVINRSIVLGIFSLIFVVFYSAIMLTLEQSISAMNLPNLDKYLIFLLFLIFTPFLNLIVRKLNSIIFMKVYKSIGELKDLSRAVLSSISTSEIVTLTTAKISKILSADSSDIFLKNKSKYTSPLNNKIFNRDELSEESLLYEIVIGENLKGYLLLSGVVIVPDKLLEDKVHQFIADLAIALSNAELHEKVTEMNDKVLQSEKVLSHENKLSTVGLMAAKLAHEIKNPLGTIQNMISLMPKKKNDNVYFTKFMEIVPRQLSRIDDLMKLLLDYSRPPELNMREVEIDTVIKASVDLLNSRLTRNKVKVKVSLALNKATLMADADALEQVFINLLLNAVESIKSANGKIKISSRVVGANLMVVVHDTGTGISAKDIKEIFDPFFTTKKSGNGLGLATVRNIVNAHGGVISVKSKIGKGTEFTIKLPLNR